MRVPYLPQVMPRQGTASPQLSGRKQSSLATTRAVADSFGDQRWVLSG